MRVRLVQAATSATTLLLSLGLTAAHAAPTPQPESATAAPIDVQTLVLSADQQPPFERPTLDRLSREAETRGISLKQALDDYAADVIASNPSAQRAMPDGPVPDPAIDIDGIPFAELIDLNRLAGSEGISFEEAIDRYAWTPRVKQVSVPLRQNFPDDFTGLAIADDGRSVRIAFKDKIPPEAVALAQKLPVEVTMTGGKGFSEKELHDTLQSRYDLLVNRPEVSEATGSPDFETGVITLKAELKKSVARADVDSDALQPQPSANSKIDIQFEIVDSLGIRPIDNWLRGGGFLEKSGGVKQCTAGFNAISDAGVKHATTARHCATTDDTLYLWYENHPSYHTQGTTLGRAFRAGSYDIARYQGGSLNHTRTFYYELNLPRYVRAIQTNYDIGDPICSFGRTTAEQGLGARCGKIKRFQTSFCGPSCPVTDYQMLGGDSGGPSYWGSTALGINASVLTGETLITPIAGYSSDAGGLGSNWRVWTCPTC